MFKNFNSVYEFSKLNGWTASSLGTDEYYYSQSVTEKPLLVMENGNELTEGTLGALNAGEWAYGDNDSLGYNTVYVRLSDSTIPATDEVTASISQNMIVVPTGKSLGVVSIEIRGISEDANLKIIRVDGSEVELFSFILGVKSDDYAILDHGITLTSEQQLKIQSDKEGLNVMINANEVG